MDLIIKNNIIHIFSADESLFQAAANDFVQRAIKTINEKSFFTVVLSGGDTPKFFFKALVEISQKQPSIPWQQIKFFFGDERFVASEDSASNYHMAYQYLFSKLPIPAENIYRIPTECSNPEIAAEKYEQTLRKAFDIKSKELPLFDLVYLGLGENAHTASLMPGSDLVKSYIDNPKLEKNPLVASAWVPELNMFRVTLTPTALNHSRNISFLVTGESKATAAWQVLQGSYQPLQYPAQMIHCKDGKTVWYLDQPAAKKLII